MRRSCATCKHGVARFTSDGENACLHSPGCEEAEDEPFRYWEAKGDWFDHKRCRVCGKVFARLVNREVHEQYIHGIDHGRARNGRQLAAHEREIPQ